MRLIDADRLLSEKMKSKYYHLPNGDIAIPLIDIEHAPTIEERKTGRWVSIDDGPCDLYECNQCGTTYDTICNTWDLPRFCPDCGAKMKE